MNRRSDIAVALLVASLIVVLPGTLRAQERAAPRVDEAIERQPYRILFHLGCDPGARIDEGLRVELLRRWQVLARRFVGAPWVVTIAEPASSLGSVDLEAADPASFAGVGAYDKVWVVRITRSAFDSGLVLSGREYDAVTRRVGPLQRRGLPSLGDAPRALFVFSRDLFSPFAIVTGQEGGKAILTARAAAIAPASPAGQVVTKGTVFAPMRMVSLPDKSVRVLRIRLSYLQVEAVEGISARCAIVSPYLDPLSNRDPRPHRFVALGLKPGDIPTRLRFVTKPDKAPAGGFTLTARLVPDGQPRELGTTDRMGRIVLKPGFADGLVILRLLAGYIEPLVELPMMPGESTEEQEIPVDTLPLTVALETQVDSLRDEVIDLVAMRARLESRMKARLDGEDWSGLEESVKEFSKLPPRDEFAQKLTKLKDEATQRQAESKKPILTRTALAEINDLQSLIDRYLDDDTFKAYSDAVEQAQALGAAKTKGATAKAGKPRTAATASRAGSAPAAAASPNAGSPGRPAAAAPAPPVAPPPQRNAAPSQNNVPF
ncbi:MAG: hypothetical protein ACLQIB_18920 [Isosphaeraceae bacterium]